MLLTNSPLFDKDEVTSSTNSDIIVNKFLVDAEDLELGNAITKCFVNHTVLSTGFGLHMGWEVVPS